MSAMLPARIQTSLGTLRGQARQARIGEMLNPTAAHAAARPVGTAAAQVDFYDRTGGDLERLVQTLTGRPPVQPTATGQVPRLPYDPPGGAPSAIPHSADLLGAKGWESIASQGERTLQDAMDKLDQIDTSKATSQAEIMALQVKIQQGNMMFNLASRTMQTAHETRKAVITNLRA
jgi:hypothetical protein